MKNSINRCIKSYRTIEGKEIARETTFKLKDKDKKMQCRPWKQADRYEKMYLRLRSRMWLKYCWEQGKEPKKESLMCDFLL